MTARLRAACHWSTVTVIALLFAQAAPFTGWYATAVIAGGVGLIGLATAPHPGART